MQRVYTEYFYVVYRNGFRVLILNENAKPSQSKIRRSI